MTPSTPNPAHFALTPIAVPVGAVITYAGKIGNASPPENYTLYPETQGWMVCDGRALQPSMYPELFSALGYLYGGSGDSFNIPDLQGMFLRGITNTDAALENRTAAPNGTADGVGSTQTFALQTHVHTYTAPNNPAAPGGDKGTMVVTTINAKDDTSAPEQSTSQSPGNVKVSQYETRPDNTFIYYLIKYTSRLPSPIFNI